MPKEKTTSLQSRLSTFRKGNWSLAHPDMNDLAYAGFSMDESGTAPDAVICDFCMKALENWCESDVPVREHEKHASYCPLFQLHTLQGRYYTFQFGNHNISGSARKAMASLGFVFYFIEKKYPSIFCSNCDFACQIVGDEMHLATPRIKELHKWHSIECAKSREGIEEEIGNNLRPPRTESFFYSLISGKVDFDKITKYSIHLTTELNNNIKIETPTWSEYMTSLSLPKKEMLYKHKESSEGEINEGEHSVSAEQTLQSRQELSSSHEASNANISAFEGHPSIQASAEKAVQHPADEPRQTLKGLARNSLAMLAETGTEPETKENAYDALLIEKISAIPWESVDSPEDALSSSKTSVQEVSPDGIVTQLCSFISEEEKSTLRIRDALILGLKRMIKHIRNITTQDIDNVTSEILQMF
ncbi:hypothetical protein NEMIN01_0570 [Nematocida minor]|uniref:uncharacterized protein n=1 Tax=Nematocida minor TaxID=1912983 RepID=UPI00221EFDAB|nr:uncharacterized protein NEMIN01_0570 [Nematocida minor]KAI5189617.1 hypothetical protein NEMIN01_0570 [Nematocida minor]